MTTIKDIAKKANVSIGTVDRVIHNRPGVSKKTKAHIDRIIKESNFQINKIASTLALNKSYRIAVLIPESTDSEFWAEPKKGIEKATEEIKNFRISTTFFFFNQFETASYIQAFDNIIEEAFDAVLIAPVFHKETISFIHLLDVKKTPYIFINIEIKDSNSLSFIGQNSFKSGYLSAKLMNLMIPNSCQILIPVFRLNKGNHLSIENRILGFKSYFEENNNTIIIAEIMLSDINDTEAINALFEEQFQENSNVSGIFVPSSHTYLVASYLELSNRKHIKLVGHDTTTKNRVFLERDTIDFLMSQNPYHQGHKGIKLLSDFLLLNKKPNPIYHSPITIVTKENLEFIKT